MKTNTKRIIFAILIIINCIVIFSFSNKIADDSSKQSGIIVKIISEIILSIKNMQEPEKTLFIEETLTTIVRKTAHFSIYTLLGLLSMNFALTFESQDYKKIIIALLFCIFYAITDEIHQFFVPGRSCELRDVCIDSLGALTGILLTIVVTKLYRKLKENKKEDIKSN